MWVINAVSWPLPSIAAALETVPGLTWLDGGLAHGQEGRFSFLGVAPCEVVEADSLTPDPLSCLAELERSPRDATRAGSPLDPSSVPRWMGHIAYDAHPYPRAKQRHARPRTLPSVRFCRYDAVYVQDHLTGQSYIAGDDAQACGRLAQRLAGAAGHTVPAFRAGPVRRPCMERHMGAVESALEAIRAGEVYEINLAHAYSAAFEGSPLGLFCRMREASPVPLGYFSRARDHAVLGRSMERFLRFRRSDRSVWTCPIKGTIVRDGDDARGGAALASDPKEQAEHAMVVDLMRSDLSRVAKVGSVRITDLMRVHPFAGLSHLVSTVQAEVRPEVGLETLLRQTFPPGSVTGTPKERALELIEDLEQQARGAYTGAVGFVDRAGGLSLAVSIRTAIVADGMATYFSGGGIVLDSIPRKEADETELKAQVFLRALGVPQA